MTEIPGNVNAFIMRCAYIIARTYGDLFFNENEMYEQEAESPLEIIFITALNTLLRINSMQSRVYKIDEETRFAKGVFAIPQAEIGKYRVDFLLKCNCNCIYKIKDGMPESDKCAVIELDGHEFHEKDEKQRRYEKKRDRFLQKEGYIVFHYTGKEIVNNPFSAAAECLSFLTGEDEEKLCVEVNKYREESLRKIQS